ncbi:YqgQ family protein [Carnobacterium sp. ISL-102]|jgi:uncharacterized protein YqgQ|uniref:YqgQ family protein n=1 Tax=Carnobacterium TaxID=2747 RepID=UPI001BE8435A|nr:YqgQ family protein [Carnobacterium sp. ISL-102]MBT2732885.1 YqgQ family protein [Carnobacterium sp. ISL-102]
MVNLYDVQQLLKRFGIYVYIGKRLWDIEIMMVELKKLHDNGLILDDEYLPAILILKQEHRKEEEKEQKS